MRQGRDKAGEDKAGVCEGGGGREIGRAGEEGKEPHGTLSYPGDVSNPPQGGVLGVMKISPNPHPPWLLRGHTLPSGEVGKGWAVPKATAMWQDPQFPREEGNRAWAGLWV